MNDLRVTMFCILGIVSLGACGKPNQFASKSTESSGTNLGTATATGTSTATGTGTGDGTGQNGSGEKSGKFAWQVLAERPVLDLVVLPDTSGGQTTQSDRIVDQKVSLQDRLAKLAINVSLATDLKIILLAPSRTTNVNLGIDVADFKHANSVQIDVDSSIQGSYLLALSAVASCQATASRTVVASGADPRLGVTQALEICGKPSTAGVITGTTMEKILSLGGKLSSQFRFGAKRAYLFLSTAAPEVFFRNDFLSVFKAAGMTLPAVFAFQNNSDDYKQLAQQTGGLDFDYKLPDWSDSFKRLGEKLISVAGAEQTLLGVTEVVALKAPLKIQGKDASEDCFSVKGNKVSVSTQCIKDLKLTKADVEVSYTFK